MEDAKVQDATAPQGAARLSLKEMKVLLENAISALPRNLRTVYVLREVQHLTTDEAAACLGVSPREHQGHVAPCSGTAEVDAARKRGRSGAVSVSRGVL